VSCLPDLSRAQRLHVLWAQHLLGGSPVEVEFGGVVRLEHQVGEILPENERRGLTEESLTQKLIGPHEVTLKDQVGGDRVGERGDRVDDLVGKQGSEGPREVARVLTGEGNAANQFEGSLTQCQGIFLRGGGGVLHELLELSPVRSYLDELVARLAGGSGQVVFTDDFSSVGHVVEHDGTFDIVHAVHEGPDGCLNLVKGHETARVHGEEGDDCPCRLSHWGKRRCDLQGTQDVNAKRGLISRRCGGLVLCGHCHRWVSNESRGRWRYVARRTRSRSRRHWTASFRRWARFACRWCLAHEVASWRVAISSSTPALDLSIDPECEHDHDKCRTEIEETCKALTRGQHVLRCCSRCRDGQVLGERKGNPGVPSDFQHRWRLLNVVVVLNAESSTRLHDYGAVAVRYGHGEVVGGVDETVGVRRSPRIRPVDRVDASRRVSPPRLCDVPQRRSGKWRHLGEVVAKVWTVCVRRRRSSGGHLQRKINFAGGCADATAVGALRVQRGTRNQEDRRMLDMVERIGHRNFVESTDLVNSRLLNLTGARPRRERATHDECEDTGNGGQSESEQPI